MTAHPSKRYIVALTGASGMPYAVSLLQKLAAKNVEIHGLVSAAGAQVLKLETGLSTSEVSRYMTRLYDEKDFAAPVASGSFPHDGMIIIPCTMGTLGAIANGISNNLIHRSADVTLKEGRRLLLIVRETPLNRIHLANMLRLAEAGATIMPAMPGFYHHPRGIEELVAMFVDRILDVLGLPDPEAKRWGIDS
jgi:4-hydroxy-3-polyprenylbenzoate decarboxylase